MSIERRTYYSWFCVCDACYAEISGGFGFREAVAAKKDAGWKSIQEPSGEWIDLCPDCQKSMKEVGYHGKKQ